MISDTGGAGSYSSPQCEILLVGGRHTFGFDEVPADLVEELLMESDVLAQVPARQPMVMPGPADRAGDWTDLVS